MVTVSMFLVIPLYFEDLQEKNKDAASKMPVKIGFINVNRMLEKIQTTCIFLQCAKCKANVGLKS